MRVKTIENCIIILVSFAITVVILGRSSLSPYFSNNSSYGRSAIREGRENAASTYDERNIQEKVAARAEGPLLYNDSLLHILLRDRFLQHPSNLTYNLQEISHHDIRYLNYKITYPSWVFIKSILYDLFNTSNKGYFIEAGALDGEYLSNSLYLEREFGWNGLLIEPDHNNYKELEKKHRKAWLSKSCTGIKPFAYTTVLSDYKVNKKHVDWSVRGAARIHEDPLEIGGGPGYLGHQKIYCFPIASLLIALNISNVDVFSLDVEGSEMDILKHFPFDQIDVSVWVIEHIPNNSQNFINSKFEVGILSNNSIINKYNTKINTDLIYNKDKDINTTNPTNVEDIELIEFMENKGYYYFDVFCNDIPDYIFIKVNSYIFRKLKVPYYKIRRRNLCHHKQMWDAAHMKAEPKYLRDPAHWPNIQYN